VARALALSGWWPDRSYLEDNYRVSGNPEVGRPMTALSTVRARARRWNVREIPFPKLVRGKY